MSRSPRWLLDFASNVHSQAGEDGILQQILEMLPQRDAWCVEFGAWDGAYLSNVCNLTTQRGYSAVLIECDAQKYGELKQRFAGNERIIALNRFVGFEATDGLDSILRDTPIPRDFDLLSIDIDGNDYHAWDCVTAYRPKVVCIEFNPTIPTEVDFVQPRNPSLNQGASLAALVRLGKGKGYELVSVLPWNAIFVRREHFPLFEIDDNRPETLRADLSAITYLFSGFDGSILVRGNRTLPWHGMQIKESRLQLLPGFLRRYPLNYGRLKKAVFRLYRSLTGSRLSPLDRKGRDSK